VSRRNRFVKQCDRDYFYCLWFYETEWHSFALLCFRGTECQSFAVFLVYGSELQSFAVFWFLKYRVTELHLEFVSQDRLSETYFVVNDQSKVTWNARQRIKLSSTLPRDPKTCSGALQELNKATAFWRYQFLQRAAHLDKPNSISPGQVTFWRTHAAIRDRAYPQTCATLAMQHPSLATL